MILSIDLIILFLFVELIFIHHFTSGDLLDAPEWDERHALVETDKGTQHDAQHFKIALELADFIS